MPHLRVHPEIRVQVFRRPRVIHTFWRVTVNSQMSRLNLPTVRNFYGRSSTSSRNKRQSLSSATARRSFEAYEPGVALGETGIYHPTPPADGESFSDSEEEESISSGFNDFSFDTSLPLERDRSHLADQYSRTSTPTTTVTPNLQRTPLNTNSQVISMLQQQQSVLQQVLDSQKKLQDRQNTIEEQLHELQKKVSDTATPCTSSNDEKKRKRVVTRTLSVSIHSCLLLLKLAMFNIHRKRCMPCIVQVRNNLILMNRKLIKYILIQLLSISALLLTGQHLNTIRRYRQTS